jgi:muconate cycloisomerase
MGDNGGGLVIKRFAFTEVIVPAKAGVINSDALAKPLHMLPVGGKASWSVQFDTLPKLILKLHLSNGVVGLGEFYRDCEWGRVRAIAEALVGTDLRDLSLQKLPLPVSREYDGFECAIWDAYAKSFGLPLHALIGGKVRDAVKITSWSSHRTIDEVGEWVARYHRQGFDCIKFKTDLDDDVIGWCEEIAHAAPGMKIIFDPNQRWENAASVKPIIRGLEKVGNTLLLEDPIPKWMAQDYADLRWFSSIPITQHVSLPYVYQGQRVHDVANLIANRAVDGFNFNGGLAKFQQMAAIATASNLFCFHGSEVDLGILEAMYVHQAAAAECCVWPSDIFGRMIREHDLLKTPLRIKPPYAFVPEGPGLGVELDEAALERYAVGHHVVGDGVAALSSRPALPAKPASPQKSEVHG